MIIFNTCLACPHGEDRTFPFGPCNLPLALDVRRTAYKAALSAPGLSWLLSAQDAVLLALHTAPHLFSALHLLHLLLQSVAVVARPTIRDDA